MKSWPYQDRMCRCFSKPGPGNTPQVLEILARYAVERRVENLLIASSSGETARKALQILGGAVGIIAVTHVTGFAKPNVQEMDDATRRELEAQGARILTCQHAFGGVGRAVRKKLGTYQVDEIMAYTLRTFGQGVKVAIEISLMAADAGLIRTDCDVISTGGTGSGIDTALLIKPANSSDFFDLKIREIICKPETF